MFVANVKSVKYVELKHWKTQFAIQVILLILCAVGCIHVLIILSIVVASLELPMTKCKCISCKTVFDIVIRAQYEEFQIDNAQKLCSDGWHKQFHIERKLWEEEQRREIGPAWEGVSTRKKVALKSQLRLRRHIQKFCRQVRHLAVLLAPVLLLDMNLTSLVQTMIVSFNYLLTELFKHSYF